MNTAANELKETQNKLLEVQRQFLDREQLLQRQFTDQRTNSIQSEEKIHQLIRELQEKQQELLQV